LFCSSLLLRKQNKILSVQKVSIVHFKRLLFIAFG